jgi:hypothetical protein
MSPRWQITELSSMPTLGERPDADLKWDNGEIRVWLRRPTEDGGCDAPDVVVERKQSDGGWK